MSRYITLLLIIGLAFWGCEEEQPKDCAGNIGGNAIEKIKVQINNNHPHKQKPLLLGGAKYHPSDYETYEYSSILLD